MMRYLLFLVQLRLLKTSHFFSSMFWRRQSNDWVLGVQEIASFLRNISESLDCVRSVCLYDTPYYAFDYDVDWTGSSKAQKFKRLIFGPILLGYFVHRYKGFIYLGSAGFLISDYDGRDAEMAFIKSKNKQIVVFFLGSEIRSYALQKQYCEDNDIELIVSYQGYVNPSVSSQKKEKLRKRLAEAADSYASVIFNPPIDQMSYLKRDSLDILYFYPERLFSRNERKWLDFGKLKIFHGPSSPIVKGTPLVRAAIKKLKMEGYDFDYQEMSGVDHSVILNNLATSHIVLNQFYAQVPGVFGVEALASGCVLLTSADRTIEQSLPKGANEAWVVTPYWDIYDTLKNALETPVPLLEKQANIGYQWALENYSSSKNAQTLKRYLNSES